ncbi:hypothetical protein SFRURICE_001348 [Spodoptera frugiperda]|nr:hypothetical protein SFRURICE_001348 [Spodoptera frugiperda]
MTQVNDRGTQSGSPNKGPSSSSGAGSGWRAGGKCVYRTQKSEEGCSGSTSCPSHKRAHPACKWRGESPKRRGSAAKKRSGSGVAAAQGEARCGLASRDKPTNESSSWERLYSMEGVTYGDVLDKLKGAVTPAEFGAPDGFSMKVTATGARLLEVPGAASGSSADALAERIRACLEDTKRQQRSFRDKITPFISTHQLTSESHALTVLNIRRPKKRYIAPFCIINY